MLQRLYVHNFRCLDNFELKLAGTPSALLVGKNGSGKSSVARALKLLQRVARGQNLVKELVRAEDCFLGRTSVPLRFELEAILAGRTYRYLLALELPEHFRQSRIQEESLVVDDQVVFKRVHGQVSLTRGDPQKPEAQFIVDWHLVALPVIQDRSEGGPLTVFRQWLARMMILAPVPGLMTGSATGDSLEPEEDGSNFADWLSGLLAEHPAAYTDITAYLQQVMPDLAVFRNLAAGRDAKNLMVRFAAGQAQHEMAFDQLSDGEKCFFLSAVVLAANRAYGPLFVFWDEPDNYLSLSEVGHFVMSLRQGFQGDQAGRGQILITSHSEEVVRKFSGDNTWVLGRRSHLEPTLIRPLSELPTADVVLSLITGDLEP